MTDPTPAPGDSGEYVRRFRGKAVPPDKCIDYAEFGRRFNAWLSVNNNPSLQSIINSTDALFTWVAQGHEKEVSRVVKAMYDGKKANPEWCFFEVAENCGFKVPLKNKEPKKPGSNRGPGGGGREA